MRPSVYPALIVLLTALAPFGRAEAQVEVSPRLAYLAAMGSGTGPASDAVMAGVRMRRVRSTFAPYGALYLRGSSVSGSEGPRPPGGGIHATVGVTVEGGDPGSGLMRAHASLGAGVVFWRNSDWGRMLVSEFEGGVTIPTSDSFGLLLALRLEHLMDEGALWGGTLGVAWRMGG